MTLKKWLEKNDVKQSDFEETTREKDKANLSDDCDMEMSDIKYNNFVRAEYVWFVDGCELYYMDESGEYKTRVVDFMKNKNERKSDLSIIVDGKDESCCGSDCPHFEKFNTDEYVPATCILLEAHFLSKLKIKGCDKFKRAGACLKIFTVKP